MVNVNLSFRLLFFTKRIFGCVYKMRTVFQLNTQLSIRNKKKKLENRKNEEKKNLIQFLYRQ